MKRIIIGITGASGTVYAVDLLQKIKQFADVETHLVMSKWAKQNLALDTDYQLNDITALADYVYDDRDQSAKIASGSFLVDGMVIVPASMKTIAGIAYGFADNLIGRAADVMLKEQRKLVVVPRESPLSTIHLENLTKLSQLGVQIIPPIPSFYNHPTSIQDLLDHQSMKTLDALNIPNNFSKRWNGK
ncbi:UbiX family flavin prenyltransferase [Bombilactobacillus thymidiniphilus]|uniref:Flavin prenyltransferase UbiX n=1 Tax=Bombilactobacillus thymidiniphilus TaxID=2923363 RepID=A0ABY4PFI0_9LACO|nr:UbiX family flavin prenyltransferase [Bombilactobacillus thymidiniphilus]UQS84072.1 UbiX family flavin prenyltransferase [Bombilactobacillus thymidiniphilus]